MTWGTSGTQKPVSLTSISEQVDKENAGTSKPGSPGTATQMRLCAYDFMTELLKLS